MGTSKSASAFSAQITQMDKKLVEMSTFVGQLNLEFKTALQNLDSKP